jgi:hypothetical protein
LLIVESTCIMANNNVSYLNFKETYMNLQDIRRKKKKKEEGNQKILVYELTVMLSPSLSIVLYGSSSVS